MRDRCAEHMFKAGLILLVLLLAVCDDTGALARKRRKKRTRNLDQRGVRNGGQPSGMDGLSALFNSLGDMGLETDARGDNGMSGGKGSRKRQKRRNACPRGQALVPKDLDDLLNAPRRNQFIANGCGPEGMQVKEPFGLWQCCNGHDVCYSTCGATFDHCEEQFGSCMQGVCDRIDDKKTSRACHEQANSFTGMTKLFGRGSHAASQRDTCECKSEGADAKLAWRRFIEALREKSGTESSTMGWDEIGSLLPDSTSTVENTNDDPIDILLHAWKGREGELAFAMVRQYGVHFVKATGSTPLAFIGRDHKTLYRKEL